MTAQTATTEKGLRIMGLQMDQFMGIRVLRLDLDGASMVEISGKNGAGKTSVKRGIEAVLAGIFPEESIRRGAKKARVCLTLGMQPVAEGSPEVAYTLDLAITEKGATLTITDADGQPIKRPREWLKERFAAQGCDPLAFAMMAPREQVDLLKRVTGLGERFAEIDRLKSAALQNARDAKRGRELAEAQVAATPDVKGPDVESTVTELLGKLEAARAVNLKNAEAKGKLAKLRDGLAQRERDHAELGKQIEALQQKQWTLSTEITDGKCWLQDNAGRIETAKDEDLAPISAAIQNVEQTNDIVRRRKVRRDALQKLEEAGLEEQACKDAIAQLDDERRLALEECKLPVEGLEFDENGVRLNGVPIRQANSAAQIRCGVGLALAEGKRIRVLATEYGSLLDSEGRKALAELAEQHDAQCFVEIAADGPGRGIFIEDGVVKEGGVS